MLSRSSSEVPHTMLSHSSVLHTVPQTMLSPSRSRDAPHTVEIAQALPVGLMTPIFSFWLPQRIVFDHALLLGYSWPACGLLRNRARSTAPLTFRKPAPCVSASY